MPKLNSPRLPQSFRDRVYLRPDGCWLWIGAYTSDGYGQCSVRGKRLMASHVAYATFVGPVPENHFLRHSCGERRCVNTDHLLLKEGNPLAETRAGRG